jgi:hypothetical protein
MDYKNAASENTLYIFTTKNYETDIYSANIREWGVNITHGSKSDYWLNKQDPILAYKNVLLAVFMAPTHVAQKYSVMWECEGDIVEQVSQLKCRCTSLTTLRQIPMPIITLEQRVKFAILCALQLCNEIWFVDWANNWLNGKDRTAMTAINAANIASGMLRIADNNFETANAVISKANIWRSVLGEGYNEADRQYTKDTNTYRSTTNKFSAAKAAAITAFNTAGIVDLFPAKISNSFIKARDAAHANESGNLAFFAIDKAFKQITKAVNAINLANEANAASAAVEARNAAIYVESENPAADLIAIAHAAIE